MTNLISILPALILVSSALAQSPPPKTVPNQRPGADPSAAVQDQRPQPTLWVGDPAPPLTVEKWIKHGDTTTGTNPLPKEQISVVEFWATWCAPCAQSIPHLTELQTKHRDRGVRIIGMSSQEMSAAELDRFVAKQGDRIGYAIALDDNGASNHAWMLAAGQRSIPTAFVVDRQGQVAWIGHPLDGLDSVLQQVVDKKHDLPAAAAAHRQRIALDLKAEPIIDRFREASDNGDHAAAIAAADQLVALDPQAFGRYAITKFQIQAVAMKDVDAAKRDAASAIDGPLHDNADVLFSLATVILDDPRLDRAPYLPLASQAAARAAELTPATDPAKLSRALTLRARVAAEQSDHTQAIALLTRALEIAPDAAEREALQRRLADYQKKAAPQPPPP